MVFGVVYLMYLVCWDEVGFCCGKLVVNLWQMMDIIEGDLWCIVCCG